MSRYDDDTNWAVLALIIVLILGIFSILLAWSWYRAGVQTDIYKRQGIEISHWEVFIGSTPAERVIQIKEHKP